MREICQLVASEEHLPAVSSADAERVYTTVFLRLSSMTPRVAATPDALDGDVSADGPDPIAHQKAKHELQLWLSGILSTSVRGSALSATAQNAVNTFVAVNRLSSWADRVFSHLWSACGDFVVERDSAAQAGAARSNRASRVPVSDVFAIRCQAQSAASANRQALAVWFADAMQQAVMLARTAPPDAGAEPASAVTTASALIPALHDAADVFLSQGLATYRNTFEASLLQHMEKVRSQQLFTRDRGANAGGITGPRPKTFDEACATYVAYCEIAEAVLHPSTVPAYLHLIADDVFREDRYLREAVALVGGGMLRKGCVVGLRGLMVPTREAVWQSAIHRVLHDYLLAHATRAAVAGPTGASGELPAVHEAVDGSAERPQQTVRHFEAVVSASIEVAREFPKFVAKATVNALGTLASTGSVTATAEAAALALAGIVHRVLEAGTFVGSVVQRNLPFLLKRLQDHINLDVLGERLEKDSIRRGLSQLGFWSSDAERALAAIVEPVVLPRRYFRARRLITDLIDSAAVEDAARSSLMPPSLPLPVMSLRCVAQNWMAEVCPGAAYLDLSLPDALSTPWQAAYSAYLARFPERRLQLLPHLSRVTIEWLPTSTRITMSTVHLSVVEACSASGSECLTVPHQAHRSRLPIEIFRHAAADLVAARVLVERPADGGNGYSIDNSALAAHSQREVWVRFGMHRRVGRTPEGRSRVSGSICPRTRRMLLEAAVMRASKASSPSTMAMLMRLVVEERRLRFDPTPRELRRAIDVLASREYVHVSDDDIVTYLP